MHRQLSVEFISGPVFGRFVVSTPSSDHLLRLLGYPFNGQLASWLVAS